RAGARSGRERLTQDRRLRAVGAKRALDPIRICAFSAERAESSRPPCGLYRPAFRSFHDTADHFGLGVGVGDSIVPPELRRLQLRREVCLASSLVGPQIVAEK